MPEISPLSVKQPTNRPTSVPEKKQSEKTALKLPIRTKKEKEKKEEERKKREMYLYSYISYVPRFSLFRWVHFAEEG